MKRDFTEKPFALHVLRVADGALAAGLVPDAVVAAVLHDIVEDTETTFEELAGLGFSARTLVLVRLLTKSPFAPKKHNLTPTEEAQYYTAIIQDHDAVCLKLLDRTDNLVDLRRALPGSRQRCEQKVEETERDFHVLRQACHNPAVVKTFTRALTALKDALDGAAAFDGVTDS